MSLPPDAAMVPMMIGLTTFPEREREEGGKIDSGWVR
jgi:hypothetical protein